MGFQRFVDFLYYIFDIECIFVHVQIWRRCQVDSAKNPSSSSFDGFDRQNSVTEVKNQSSDFCTHSRERMSTLAKKGRKFAQNLFLAKLLKCTVTHTHRERFCVFYFLLPRKNCNLKQPKGRKNHHAWVT